MSCNTEGGRIKAAAIGSRTASQQTQAGFRASGTTKQIEEHALKLADSEATAKVPRSESYHDLVAELVLLVVRGHAELLNLQDRPRTISARPASGIEAADKDKATRKMDGTAQRTD